MHRRTDDQQIHNTGGLVAQTGEDRWAARPPRQTRRLRDPCSAAPCSPARLFLLLFLWWRWNKALTLVGNTALTGRPDWRYLMCQRVVRRCWWKNYPSSVNHNQTTTYHISACLESRACRQKRSDFMLTGTTTTTTARRVYWNNSVWMAELVAKSIFLKHHTVFYGEELVHYFVDF